VDFELQFELVVFALESFINILIGGFEVANGLEEG